MAEKKETACEYVGICTRQKICAAAPKWLPVALIAVGKVCL